MSDRLAAERLALGTGIVAGRLAVLLGKVFPDGAQGGAGHDFLDSAYRSAAGERVIAEVAGDFFEHRPEPPQPLDRLADALALSRLEVELCLMAGMPDEHEGFAAVFRSLHPRGEPHPTSGLAAQLFGETIHDRFDLRALLESGRAIRAGALRLTGDAPFFERSLTLAPGLWQAFADHDAWPVDVPRLAAPIVAAGLDEWLASSPVRRAATALARREACTILVIGETVDVAFHRALAVVADAGLDPAGLAMPAQVDPALEQLVGVHALARDVVPVMRITGAEAGGTAEVPHFLNYPGPIVLAARSGALQVRVARPLVVVNVDPLTASARRRMWAATLPALAEDCASLAARYPLEPAEAAAVAADMMLLHSLDSRPASLGDTANAIRARAGLSLAGGVKLVTPVATWSDLVLAKDRIAQLREACARLMLQERVLDEWGFLRGRAGARGVRLLFAGPSGTGKTLAAEVLAHSLAVDLLYVDISKIVSKWIGETEKNLAAIFETAERAQAVLFFDEADALFGKRTEVSDAHDRYANLETAYLLSRLERFEGLAILATNLRANIDPAFIRRLEFAIDFEAPDRDERLQLWQVHVPRTAPLANDVDLGELSALYPVVGGFIRNAAAAAGFLAAGNGGVIHRSHFIHAIRREYEKGGRVFPTSTARLGNSQS